MKRFPSRCASKSRNGSPVKTAKIIQIPHYGRRRFTKWLVKRKSPERRGDFETSGGAEICALGTTRRRSHGRHPYPSSELIVISSRPTTATDRHCSDPIFISRRFCDSIFCLTTYWPLSAYAWCVGGSPTARARTLVAEARAWCVLIADCVLVFALLSCFDLGRIYNRCCVGSRKRDDSACGRTASWAPPWKRFSGDTH
jgi:hypothetical protein